MACGCNVNKDQALAAGPPKTQGQLRIEHQEAQAARRKEAQEAQAAQEARQKAAQEAQAARQKEKEERLAKKIAEMKTGKTILRKKIKRITKN
jgi:hypothetical protein